MSRWRSWLLLGIVVAALIGSALVVLGIGAVRVPVSDVARVVARRFRLIEGADVTVLNDQIVWQMRAPRVIGSMAVGALLAMCGRAATGRRQVVFGLDFVSVPGAFPVRMAPVVQVGADQSYRCASAPAFHRIPALVWSPAT